MTLLKLNEKQKWFDLGKENGNFVMAEKRWVSLKEKRLSQKMELRVRFKAGYCSATRPKEIGLIKTQRLQIPKNN